MNRLVDLLWLTLPSAVRRVWLTLGIALADGAYLRAWPPAALALPAGGFLLGALLGIAHPGTIYTYSFVVVALMLVLATLGAGVGVWTWLGYVLVDLAVTDRATLPGFYPYASAGDRLLNGYLPLLLTYLLLGALLVTGPLLGKGFAIRTATVVRRANRALALPAGQVVYVLVVTGYSYAWAQATPFLIRPLWSFGGGIPDTEAVQPIQSNTGWLALVALVGAVVRAVLTFVVAKRPARRPAVSVHSGQSGPLAGGALSLLAIPVQAGLLTLLLAGLVPDLAVGVVLFLLLCMVFVARVVAIPHIPGYAPLVRKVPLLLRILACALVSYVLSSLIVEPAVARGESSFTSLVVVIVVSLVLSAFLLPGRTLPMFGSRQGGGPAPVPPRPRGLGHPGAAMFLAVVGVAVLWPAPAYADNCSGLTDCSFAVKVGLVLAAIVLVALAIMLLPEVLAGAGLETAVVDTAGVDALGGMVTGGGSGASGLTGEALAAAQAAAESAGVEVGETVTTAEIDAVETHLSQFGEYGPNDAMVSRIRDAVAEGRPLDLAERNFMQHELTEAELMGRGMSQEAAHEASLTTHDLYANYHPDVIQQFAELFNSNWFKYWGL